MKLKWTSSPTVRALLAALLVFGLLLVLRGVFIPGADEPLLFDPDEAEMHEASLGPVLGTVPQRLIWPGGLMRHVALAHLAASAVLQGAPRTPEGLAVHIGRVLLEPGQAWAWMRWAGSLVSAVGFAAPVWLAVRLGVPWAWAVLTALAAACFPLHWRHGCMTTPDAMAWGLALVALTVTRAGVLTERRIFGSALLAGLALGSKMTLLPVMPALALASLDIRRPWAGRFTVWLCGLVLGMLVATPWFLADPVRLVKTMLGVVKFKPGEMTGAAETLRLMMTGIPAWLLAAGLAGVGAALWRRQDKGLAWGVIVSMLWLFRTAVTSKQVVDRYFPPLGMVLFFAVMIWLLPLLAAHLQGRFRRWLTAGLVLLTGLCLAQGWQTMSRETHEMRAVQARCLEVRDHLLKVGARRIAIDSTLFRSSLVQLAEPASLDALAEHLELARVGHRGVEGMLAGYGMSPSAVKVLGGLFDEVEANQSARLRAMAAGARGRQQTWWFYAGDNPVYGRQWKQDAGAVAAALTGGELDAAVFVGEVPGTLSALEHRTFAGSVPLQVVLGKRRADLK